MVYRQFETNAFQKLYLCYVSYSSSFMPCSQSSPVGGARGSPYFLYFINIITGFESSSNWAAISFSFPFSLPSS